MQSQSVFSPDVIKYMLACGYELVQHEQDLDVLTFRRKDVAVLFWQDRVERRIISPNKDAVTRNLKSFKGFDGKDVFSLMMILHLLDAVRLEDVKKEVGKLVKDTLLETAEKI